MAQVEKDDPYGVAYRLRKLRDRNELTTADIAGLTGIPKRTLESYMLKANAALPGLEALKKLSSGLGVPLDWLVFGGEMAGQDFGRLARLASHAASLPVLENIAAQHGNGGKLLGLSPEELAMEIAAEAGDKARGLSEQGARRESLDIADRVFHARVSRERDQEQRGAD